MGRYKVYYFNSRGRAEMIRLVMKASNIEFEDVRFSREEWPEYKKKSPSGQCPYVETPDGHILTQSMAIARMFAHEHGLLGKDSKETYLIEYCLGLIEDVFTDLKPIVMGTKDQEEKDKKKKEFTEGKGQTLLTEMDKCVQEGKGLLVGGRVTFADLNLLFLSDYLKIYVPALWEKHPKLAEHYDHVCKTVPAIGDWIKERPKTDF